MNKIYLTCKMNLRSQPGLKAPILKVLNHNTMHEVHSITEEIDGYRWFKLNEGYIANVEEVYYHSDNYSSDKTSTMYKLIHDFLASSVEGTTIAINQVLKELDNI